MPAHRPAVRHTPPATKYAMAARPGIGAVQRMQQNTLDTALANDVDFVTPSLGNATNVYTHTRTFAKERSAKRACQSVAIGGILNRNPEDIFKELFHIANRVNSKVEAQDASTLTQIGNVNTALSSFGFDMSEEGKQGFSDYDFASETIIVGYLISNGFTECTGGDKGKWLKTFRDSAAAGKYVLMTPGHAVAFIISGGTGKTPRSVAVFDADAGTPNTLAASSEKKTIQAVFKHA